MRSALPLLTLLAVAPLASCATETATDVRARRWMHGEPSVGRQVLALPYQAVALTGWPLEQTLDWMEEVNLPARIGDAFAFPFRRSGEPEHEP